MFTEDFEIRRGIKTINNQNLTKEYFRKPIKLRLDTELSTHEYSDEHKNIKITECKDIPVYYLLLQKLNSPVTVSIIS